MRLMLVVDSALRSASPDSGCRKASEVVEVGSRRTNSFDLPGWTLCSEETSGRNTDEVKTPFTVHHVIEHARNDEARNPAKIRTR